MQDLPDALPAHHRDAGGGQVGGDSVRRAQIIRFLGVPVHARDLQLAAELVRF
jgi:hypothetical protein